MMLVVTIMAFTEENDNVMARLFRSVEHFHKEGNRMSTINSHDS